MRLAFIMTPRKLSKGTLLTKEGELSHYIYYIEKGMLRLFYNKNQRELTEHIVHENQIAICLESYLSNTPTNLMIETLETSIIWTIDKNGFLRLSEESYEISTLYRKIFEELALEAKQQADLLRFETAQDRYKKFKNKFPEVVRRAPLTYIASLLQMTPETLSRIRKNIRQT